MAFNFEDEALVEKAPVMPDVIQFDNVFSNDLAQEQEDDLTFEADEDDALIEMIAQDELFTETGIEIEYEYLREDDEDPEEEEAPEDEEISDDVSSADVEDTDNMEAPAAPTVQVNVDADDVNINAESPQSESTIPNLLEVDEEDDDVEDDISECNEEFVNLLDIDEADADTNFNGIEEKDNEKHFHDDLKDPLSKDLGKVMDNSPEDSTKKEEGIKELKDAEKGFEDNMPGNCPVKTMNNSPVDSSKKELGIPEEKDTEDKFDDDLYPVYTKDMESIINRSPEDSSKEDRGTAQESAIPNLLEADEEDDDEPEAPKDECNEGVENLLDLDEDEIEINHADTVNIVPGADQAQAPQAEPSSVPTPGTDDVEVSGPTAVAPDDAVQGEPENLLDDPDDGEEEPEVNDGSDDGVSDEEEVPEDNEDTSDNMLETSVKWEINTELVKIPSTPINTTFSPEEINDFAALYQEIPGTTDTPNLLEADDEIDASDPTRGDAPDGQGPKFSTPNPAMRDTSAIHGPEDDNPKQNGTEREDAMTTVDDLGIAEANLLEEDEPEAKRVDGIIQTDAPSHDTSEYSAVEKDPEFPTDDAETNFDKIEEANLLEEYDEDPYENGVEEDAEASLDFAKAQSLTGSIDGMNSMWNSQPTFDDDEEAQDMHDYNQPSFHSDLQEANLLEEDEEIGGGDPDPEDVEQPENEKCNEEVENLLDEEDAATNFDGIEDEDPTHASSYEVTPDAVAVPAEDRDQDGLKAEVNGPIENGDDEKINTVAEDYMEIVDGLSSDNVFYDTETDGLPAPTKNLLDTDDDDVVDDLAAEDA